MEPRLSQAEPPLSLRTPLRTAATEKRTTPAACSAASLTQTSARTSASTEGAVTVHCTLWTLRETRARSLVKTPPALPSAYSREQMPEVEDRAVPTSPHHTQAWVCTCTVCMSRGARTGCRSRSVPGTGQAECSAACSPSQHRPKAQLGGAHVWSVGFNCHGASHE